MVYSVGASARALLALNAQARASMRQLLPVALLAVTLAVDRPPATARRDGRLEYSGDPNSTAALLLYNKSDMHE